MRRRALASTVALALLACPARAQETPQLPPPPPPSSPQYTPPPAPPQVVIPPPPPPPPPRREREREREPPRKEREREREREREIVVVRPRYVPPPPPPREGPPPAAQWVQIAFRSGLSLPGGNIQANDPMSNDFNLQVPFLVEAGLKVHPMLL